MTEQNTGGQPNDADYWYALGVQDGRDGCLVELDALQARCAELEAAARVLLRDPDAHDGENIRWVREHDLNALRSVVDGG
jgi:hypothetical protein